MTDLALFAFFLTLLALGLKRPFIWVLLYVYIDIVVPQKIGWVVMPNVFPSLIAFLAAFGGWLVMDGKKGSRFSFRQGLILALLIYCGITTLTADYPVEALDKWSWVWKSMLFAVFLPLTLRTRLRLEALATVMVLSAGAVVISGSIKTILSGGGGYGTLTSLVNANSGIYEGSTMSTMAIAMIPLVVWVARFSTVFPKHWTTWVFTGALVFACLLIPVGTQTRTGLICIGVLGVLVLRFARHRFLIAGAAAFVMMIAMPFLPESYTERMATITDHQSDTSASTRVAVWYWTLDYAKSNPMGGGFNSYLGNSFTYKTRTTVQDGGTTHVEYEDVTDEGRAFHSAYFELLGEQGWPGLALWLWIQLLGLWHMERIYRQFRKQEDRVSKSYASLAVALQQGQIIYLVGATFVGIGYQPYAFMFVGLQIGLTSLVARHQTEKREANRRNVAANRGVRAQGSQMALKPLRET